MENLKSKFTRNEIVLILVIAFGYFVDLYDLLLFSAVRQTSLADLGVKPEDITNVGISLLNWQLLGLLIGGIMFGIVADKRGRLSVLFISILTYSLANIVNAFVTSIPMYATLRFIAGLALAAELGIGITLVSETIDQNKRTYATILITSIGLLGAVTAAFTVALTHWKTSFLIGGVMGLILLVFRYNLKESPLFIDIYKKKHNIRGDFLKIISTPRLLFTYLISMLSGVSIYIYIAIFITFAPEFAKRFGITEPVTAHSAIVYFYVSLAISDIFCGILSKKLRSRKIPLLIFCGLQIIALCMFVFYTPTTASGLSLRYVLLGISSGFWGILVVNAAEQFETDIRATITASVPNLIRAAAIPASLWFKSLQPSYSFIQAAAIVGFTFLSISVISTIFMKDNFEKDLSKVE